MTMVSWASFIKSFRLDQELTQKEAAELLKVSQPTLSRWESGRQVPDMRTRRRIQRLVDSHAGLRNRLAREVVARSLCAQALLDQDLRIRAVSARFAELFGCEPGELETRSLEGPHPLGTVAQEALEAAHRAGLGQGELALVECLGETLNAEGRRLYLRQLWIPVIIEGGHLRIRVEVLPVTRDYYEGRRSAGTRVQVLSLWQQAEAAGIRPAAPATRRLTSF